jgi:hypothetical protein
MVGFLINIRKNTPESETLTKRRVQNKLKKEKKK